MSGAVVTFFAGNDATVFDGGCDEPLLEISLSSLPRAGDAVRLPVKHGPETATYRVRDVLHAMTPMDTEDHKVIVAVE